MRMKGIYLSIVSHNTHQGNVFNLLGTLHLLIIVPVATKRSVGSSFSNLIVPRSICMYIFIYIYIDIHGSRPETFADALLTISPK